MNVRPLQDRILIRRVEEAEKTRGGIIIPDSAKERPLEGKVIAVDPGSKELVVKHGAIKGFMEPMTMGYKVNPPSLLKRLKAGDTVRFTIDTAQKAIVNLEKLKP